MILKRVEKDGIVKAIYKSSNVLASAYNKETKELTITFNKGTTYNYAGVSNTDYTRFEIAESQGNVLNKKIKPTYDVTKGDDIDPIKIIKEVDKINQDGIKSLEEGIIKMMDKTIKFYAKNKEMDTTLLTNLQYLISKLQNENNN